MSDSDIWLIVEGRDHDRPHYESLLESLSSTSDLSCSIRLAEEVEVDGVSAGGKTHAISLLKHLQTNGNLATRNRLGLSFIVFMLDRDRDDFLESMIESDHVFYTHGNDVEADILLNSDIWLAVRNAYGIDSQLCEQVRRVIPDPLSNLFLLWHDWLALGLIALACDSPGCAPWSIVSKVNPGNFSRTDKNKVANISSDIRSSSADDIYEAAKERASGHLANQGTRLLKGRWIARYIEHIIYKHLSGETIRANVQPNAIIDTALATLNHDGPWAAAYDMKFAKLLGTVQGIEYADS